MKKIYLLIFFLVFFFSFQINSYYRIKNDLSLDLSIVQYLGIDIYSRYYPPFFDAIICGNLKITDEQLEDIDEEFKEKIKSKENKIKNIDIIIGIEYVNDFEFESTFFNCNINVPLDLKKEGKFKWIKFQEHDRRTKDIEIKKISIIIDEEKREIWFTIK